MQQTVGQWQKVFWIASGMLIISGALYCIFAKSELQIWNSASNENIEMVATDEFKKLRQIDGDENEEENCEKVPLNNDYEKTVSVSEEKEKI